MTPAARIEAVTALGFTDRQAAFLVTVMLHSGVCLRRQYCTFSGLVYGQKVYEFFDRLVQRGYAQEYRHGHRRTRLFRVHGKGLYRAIGETDSRFRRPAPLGRAIERLMVLDAVLADPRLEWFATEEEKIAHFTRISLLSRADLPSLRFGAPPKQTVRYFADKLPIGLDARSGTHVFLYLVTQPVPIDFRQFLHRHAELFRALPIWTLRLLVPPPLMRVVRLYQQAVTDELASPLRPAAMDELHWYFKRRHEVESTGQQPSDARYQRARDAFAAPRFRALYRSWLDAGDDVLRATTSPGLKDALARRTGRVEPTILRQSYQHLASMAGTS